MLYPRVLLIALGALSGCQFDPHGSTDLGDDARLSADAEIVDPPDAAPTAPDASTCPPGYFFSSVTGSSYHYVSGSILWLPAEMACEAEGTHLVVITSDVERNVVLGIAGPSPMGTIDQVYMGLTDRKIENTWRFVTGALATDDELPWNDGEPSGAADCTAFYRENDVKPAQGGRYDDASCTVPFHNAGYVCECDGVAVDPTAF
jgi:hypothetical protein